MDEVAKKENKIAKWMSTKVGKWVTRAVVGTGLVAGGMVIEAKTGLIGKIGKGKKKSA